MLVENSVEGYLEQLGSGDPTPGGGAAAALSSAQGAALIMMVAALTIGKAEYAEFEALNISIRCEAEEICRRLTAGIDRDAEAFLRVTDAFAMPKGIERTAAIGEASVAAAEAPLAVMEDSVAALKLAADMPGRSNAGLISDVLVAAHLLRAGLLSAYYNVEANLPAIRRRDEALAGRLLDRADRLITAGQELAQEVMERAR